MASLTKIALAGLLAFACSFVDAQLNYFDEPVQKWSSNVPPMEEGNAATISPDGQILYVTGNDGTITGIDPFTGGSLFSYRPPEDGATITSTSGVSFYEGTDSSYVVYAVRDGANGVSLDPTSRVIALAHPSGELLWISNPVVGEAAGSPLVSSDGEHVFLISNSQFTSVGHFSILETAQNGTTLFTQFNETNPFSSAGIIHSPPEGYFLGGENNPNDVIAWAFARNPNTDGVGEGGTFVFQFPRFYQSGDPLSSRYLRKVGWQSFAAPLLANSGRSLYYAVSRNQFRGWVGAQGAGGPRFQNGATHSVDFDRGNPTYLAPLNTPVPNSDESVLFCGLANNSMAAISSELEVLWTTDTASLTNVMSEAVLSIDDQYVFWSESAGFLDASSASTGAEIWRIELNGEVTSEFSISPDGTTLFIGEKNGNIAAWKVASPPSPAPSEAPSDVPSSSPSESPTSSPTKTMSPTVSLPTPPPSTAPGASPTSPPTAASATPSPTPESNLRSLTSGAGKSIWSVLSLCVGASLLVLMN